ncbi:hypothetical protein SSS_02431 [Sarcoptes scabiei]|uniref:Phorbol-ester/DAG-type domain-containing protein n=1 Tax=Sarcoptes scabiei TaxID=52283 RepID=A0A834VHE0_SARSC|nr:hypothetical protein SSS_02431 [Sarcoptes scabiei]
MNQIENYKLSKKHLENLSTILFHLKQNREDLLFATKTLLRTFQNEIESKRLMEKEIDCLKKQNGNLEQTRNQLEEDYIRMREQFTKTTLQLDRLEQSQKKFQTLMKRFQNQFKTGQWLDEDKELLIESISKFLSITNRQEVDCGNGSELTNEDNLKSKGSSRIVSNFSRKKSNSKSIGKVFKKTNSNLSKESFNRHQFSKVKNHLNFIRCFVCDTSILPLRSYYQCQQCSIKLDQKCYERKGMSLYCKKRNLCLDYDLVENVINKCLKQIDKDISGNMSTSGNSRITDDYDDDDNGLYPMMMNSAKFSELEKWLDHYIKERVRFDLSKKNSSSIVQDVDDERASTNQIIDSEQDEKEDEMIRGTSQKTLWNDIVRVCGQMDLFEKQNLMMMLLETKLNFFEKRTIAILIKHLKGLICKNSIHPNLSRQNLINRFGPLILRCPRSITLDRKRQQIYLIKIQQETIMILLELSKEYWKQILQQSKEIKSIHQQPQRLSTLSVNNLNQLDFNPQQQHQPPKTLILRRRSSSFVEKIIQTIVD